MSRVISLDVLNGDTAKLSELQDYLDQALDLAGSGNEVVLAGTAPVWLYLTIAHALGPDRRTIRRVARVDPSPSGSSRTAPWRWRWATALCGTWSHRHHPWRAAIWGTTTWRTQRDPEIIATADIGCYAYPRRETHVPVVHGAEHLV